MRTTTVLTVVLGLLLSLSSVSRAQAPTENEYLQFWKSYFQGEWSVEAITGESEGRIATGSKGTWSCKLAPAGTCMYFSATKGDGAIDYSALAGYDPSTKSWKELFFMSDGSNLVQYYTAKPGQLKGDPTGKIIEGTAKYIHPDGTTEDGLLRVTIIDRDKCEYVAFRTIGDKKLATLKTVMTRKPK